jgi:transcriptional regulator
MYIPDAFREDDPAVLQALIAARGLATFVTATASGPLATPLPLLLAAGEGPRGTLYGHLARENPQWRIEPLGEALALFPGADAYVSPSWYAAKREHGRVVPTWNYETVQARGPVEFFDEPGRLLAVLRALTARHEEGRPRPWRLEDAPDGFIAGLLGGIVGLRMPITSLAGKRKLSQNRGAADRAGVIAGLAASGREEDRRLARAMQAVGG